MAINATHPSYTLSLEDWVLMRDAYAGERHVKFKGETYLPATPGQLLDGMKFGQAGQKSYDSYKARAVFHDYVSDAVESYIGLLHQKPATFELPDGMKDMINHATNDGETLQSLLRRINEQQLVTGRLGLLLDMPLKVDPAKPMPYIALYNGESVRNWDDSNDKQGFNTLELLVLDESSDERKSEADFNWVRMEKYRVLMLVSPTPEIDNEGLSSAEADEQEDAIEEVTPREYRAGVFYARDANTVNPEAMRVPMIRGKTLDKIPFVFINSKDNVSEPDNPPLLGLGRLCMTIYRGEADYRHHLFMQGQDTLVVVGGLKSNNADPMDDTARVGAGARLDVDIGGDAKYIGVNSVGLAEVRVALENDKKRAEAKAGQLATANNAGQKESGNALEIRLAAQTATLMQIALSGAAGLERLLKIGAEWMGQDPEKVKVIPNLEFINIPVDGKTFVDLMSARTMGAPLSLESIHNVAVERGLTQFTFEEEMDKIDEEDAGRAAANKSLGLDPTGAIIPDPATLGPDGKPLKLGPDGKPLPGTGAKPPANA